MRRPLAVLGLLAAAVCGAGCPNDLPPRCVASNHEIYESCAPGYVPTFANVYSMTIEKKCITTNGCHSAVTHTGGLDMGTQDDAWNNLLKVGEDRVIPGDPACSKLIVRTNAPGEDYQMPPNGEPLSKEVRCALIQWVLQGAQP